MDKTRTIAAAASAPISAFMPLFGTAAAFVALVAVGVASGGAAIMARM